jgi:hypothetical protein
MGKRRASFHAGASEALTFDKFREYLFTRNFGRCTGKQLAENFQAVFLAASVRIAEHAIRFDELVKSHDLK